ncbi:MAG TPA: HIT family protein [Lysobacter sp.]|nr:HIT family protein [Lysobacter sp.]
MNGWTLHPQLATDTFYVASLGLSDVRLLDNALFLWLVLVPRVVGAIEWIDLPEADRHALLDEATHCGGVLRTLHRVDKLNIGAIGNVVPQLHLHVVARTTDDAAWPRPVWGGPAERYDDATRTAALARLREALARR